MMGPVRHWNGRFGKIAVGRRLVFFHRDDLVGDVVDLKVGAWVTFDVVDDDVRGPRGARVRLYGVAAPSRVHDAPA